LGAGHPGRKFHEKIKRLNNNKRKGQKRGKNEKGIREFLGLSKGALMMWEGGGGG